MGWLDVGAGAASGLKDLLAQHHVEDQMAMLQQAQGETHRKNLADEALRGRAIDAVSGDRQSAEADRKAQYANQEANRTRDDQRAVLGMMPVGTSVTRPEMEGYTRSGAAAPGMFKVTPEGAPAPVENAGGEDSETGTIRPEKIAYGGTSTQQNQGEVNRIREEGQTATAAARGEAAAATAAQRGVTNERDTARLQLERERLQHAMDAAAAKADTVKIGEGGKRSLRSIDQAAVLIPEVEKLIKEQAPDIETAPDKYNTLGNKASRLYDYAKYQAGFADESSPRIQLTKLLQPVQASQYLAGSRNWNMVQLALDHLADPKQTTARQWEALQQLKSVMPELRDAIIQSEAPQSLSGASGGAQGARKPGVLPVSPRGGGAAPRGGGAAGRGTSSAGQDLGGGFRIVNEE